MFVSRTFSLRANVDADTVEYRLDAAPRRLSS
jgi:hypothetical protein